MVAASELAQAVAAPLLSVADLGVSFGSVRALDGVSLAVRPGELVALAGENGAGKTTLVRCIAGDISPTHGEVFFAGRRVPPDPGVVARQGVAVVWQDLALCENLDVAANVLLGRETRRMMFSDSRFHAAAASLLDSLGIPIRNTTRRVSTLSGGQRQLVAVARAMGSRPRLLALDEPTASLGVMEAAQVEQLIAGLRQKGTTILLACHDIDQMFRLADRIVVLRQGRIVADLDPLSTHPDDVVALLSGQPVDSTARRQLTRLHGLADRLVSADPSSSLSLILSALSAALDTPQLCMHLVRDQALICAASLGFAPGQLAAWAHLPFGPAGGPVGLAALSEKPVIEGNVRASTAWLPFGDLARINGVASSWSIPVTGPGGLSGVITVFRPQTGLPQRQELQLVTLYAGYAASTVERDRLLEQATARNRVLETIREMLENLAGPIPVTDALIIAVQALRHGLQADEVALVTRPDGMAAQWRAFAAAPGIDPAAASPAMRGAADTALAEAARDGAARQLTNSQGRRVRLVPFTAASGPAVLLASWKQPSRGKAAQEENALMEDAAHSLRLALDREEAGLAHQEAAALRRSGELQRDFLSRLSHELRTPLTAIRGYASSLMQPDVTWDRGSQDRFLERIAAESARLGRLVDDLLDFSTIESGLMRLQPDWCDIPLVLQAAIACVPAAGSGAVSVQCDTGLPAVWADHDRLEQVFVNLVNNAVGHNPPDTQVQVTANTGIPATRTPAGTPGTGTPTEVVISVTDDGAGIPDDLAVAPFEAGRRRRTRAGGAGLGLSIAHGIVAAHGGRIELQRLDRGTCFRVFLPVEAGAPPAEGGEHPAEVDGQPGEVTTRPTAVTVAPGVPSAAHHGRRDPATLVPGGIAPGGNHRV
jgi:signal transduction histidine kinase/ABC-type multidrug transport system ATPase subunit